MTTLKERLKKPPVRLRSESVLGDMDSLEWWVDHESFKKLQTELIRAVEALEEAKGCWDAAITEGLRDVLAETQDERLRDLVERRLEYSDAAVTKALEEIEKGIAG